MSNIVGFFHEKKINLTICIGEWESSDLVIHANTMRVKLNLMEPTDGDTIYSQANELSPYTD